MYLGIYNYLGNITSIQNCGKFNEGLFFIYLLHKKTHPPYRVGCCWIIIIVILNFQKNNLKYKTKGKKNQARNLFQCDRNPSLLLVRHALGQYSLFGKDKRNLIGQGTPELGSKINDEPKPSIYNLSKHSLLSFATFTVTKWMGDRQHAKNFVTRVGH